MIQYVRKYFYLYLAITLIPAFIYVAVVFFAQGTYGLVSGWTWAVTFALVATMAIGTSRMMNRAAGTEMKRYMQLFYEKCDPRAFLEQGAEIARNIKAPFNEWGSLFLCAYGLAYLEVNEKEKAQGVVDAMRKSAQSAKRNSETIHILLNMHAPIKQLYGTDMAMGCLNEAEKRLILDANFDYSEEKTYIAQERAVDIAESLSDYQEIIKLNGAIFVNERIFTRTRVVAAYEMAKAYRQLGDFNHEKACLEFVVEKGNKLKSVEYAKLRLSEISDAQE